jgi:pectinesterase
VSLLSRRDLLAGAGAALALRAGAAPRFDAVAGETHPTLQAALDAKRRTPWRILLKKGVWREKIAIREAGVQIFGEDRLESVLTYADSAGQTIGTPGSATLTVLAPDCVLHNLTIANGFDYLAALKTLPAMGNGAQAVALWLAKGADRTWFSEVEIIGHQDTLFTDSGTSLFQSSRITGSVDFIFGAGRALFDGCDIVSRFRPGLQRNHGFIAAPSTSRSEPFGLVFRRCRLSREPSVPPASVVLGRPYRPRRQFADGAYGDPDAVGAATFLACWMDDHISADGWDEMYYYGIDGNRRPLQPQDARLAEYASEGPGAFENRRRRWLSAEEAARFTDAAILGAWRPDPGTVKR